MNIEELKRLAGVNEPQANESSMGENLSYIGTQKSQYQRKHNIKPGSPEWFKLWFAKPRLTGENPMPKSK
jgi:hypothetical protein